MKTTKATAGLIALVLALAGTAAASMAEKDDAPIKAFQERTYQGKPLSYWLQALRNRDEDLISTAFDAIRSLDEDAWIAVPDLTELVAAPFVAIHINKDSHAAIATKLYDIAVRTEAIETLAWIGKPGAPAAATLIQWALTNRVVASTNRDSDENELFIELVALDAEQRMRIAGAVAAFGSEASHLIAGMLTSPDGAERKLAVAILSQDALPIATELMGSAACEDRRIGLDILKDMDLVVSAPLLDALARQVRENCAMLTKLH
jgi:hypothetical protein